MGENMGQVQKLQKGDSEKVRVVTAAGLRDLCEEAMGLCAKPK